MLDWMFIIIFIAMIILILVAIADYSSFWSLTCITLAIVLAFILGLGALQIDTEYAIYNVSSEQIETGYHSYTPVTNVFLSYLFTYGITSILIIYLVVRVYDEYKIFKGYK